jgi:hypothetical protein
LAALRRWMWWIHLVPAAAPPIPALPSPTAAGPLLSTHSPPRSIGNDGSAAASRKEKDARKRTEETYRNGVAPLSLSHITRDMALLRVFVSSEINFFHE